MSAESGRSQSRESGRSHDFTSGYEAYEKREEGRRDLASEYLQVGTTAGPCHKAWALKPHNIHLMHGGVLVVKALRSFRYVSC